MASVSEPNVAAIDESTRWAPTASSSSSTPRPIPRRWARCSSSMGFTRVARHRSKNVVLYRQGDINFIVNAEPDTFAQRFARVHGPSRSAPSPSGCKDAAAAYKRALELGAWGVESTAGPMELNIPAIKGIGDCADLPGRPLSGDGAACRSTTSTSCRSPGVEQHPHGRRA